MVVVRQFFAGSNLSQTDQPQPFSDRPKHQVGLATVIDQLGSVATRSAVDRPVRIEPSQVVQASASAGGSLQKSPPRLRPGDSFSRIFNNFASRRDILGRKYAQAVNSGITDAQLEMGGSRDARLGRSGGGSTALDTHQERERRRTAARRQPSLRSYWTAGTLYTGFVTFIVVVLVSLDFFGLHFKSKQGAATWTGRQPPLQTLQLAELQRHGLR